MSYSEKRPFNGFPGVYLTALVGDDGRQELVMTYEDESGTVLARDAINCIHTAVAQVPLDEVIKTYSDEDETARLINARSSEKLMEVNLEPAEKFTAFKSWVAGIAEAGPNAFLIQSEIESVARFAYPISSKLLGFIARINPEYLDLFLSNVERKCVFNRGWHEPSLIANLKSLTNCLDSMTDEQKSHVADCIISADYPINVLKEFISLPGITNHLSTKCPELSSIIKLIKQGKPFYESNTPKALEQALAYGSVATLPQLIAGKALADKNNYLWQNLYTALSEEVIGTYEGKEYFVIVHGGGILTPARMKKAINKGLINGSAELSQEEFDNALTGNVNGKTIPVYTSIDEITDPLGHYAIKIPLEMIKKTKSGQQTKEEFMNNPLVLARNGGTQNLEAYFNKAQLNNTVGNYYWLERDASTPQGRLLFVLDSSGGHGLDYDYLDVYGGFVGVAPS